MRPIGINRFVVLLLLLLILELSIFHVNIDRNMCLSDCIYICDVATETYD